MEASRGHLISFPPLCPDIEKGGGGVEKSCVWRRLDEGAPRPGHMHHARKTPWAEIYQMYRRTKRQLDPVVARDAWVGAVRAQAATVSSSREPASHDTSRGSIPYAVAPLPRACSTVVLAPPSTACPGASGARPLPLRRKDQVGPGKVGRPSLVRPGRTSSAGTARWRPCSR